VTDELPVHVSREELHSIDVPASFDAHGPFDVIFSNHGESIHVHLHLDDTLSELASVEASNHYVEGGSQRAVRVHVDTAGLPEEPVMGKLKLVSAYGAVTRWVDVQLSAPEEAESEVEVDEALSSPTPPEPDQSGSVLDRPELPVLGLGAVAVLVAVVAAIALGDPLVVAGAVVVFAGVAVALSLLFRA